MSDSPLEFSSPNLASFLIKKMEISKGKPVVWNPTLVTPAEKGKVILKFDIQPITKNQKIYCWQEPDETGNAITLFASEQEILENYFPYWKEKMIEIGKESEINEENCIFDFTVIHGAWLLEPRPKTKES